MFISKAEKAEIIFKIRSLEARVRDLEIKAFAEKFSAKAFAEKVGTIKKDKTKKRHQSESSRLAQSERMKKYWADRKAKKETS